MKQQITFNGDAAFRQAFVKQVKKHYKADQIVQGVYGTENGKWQGCYLGCSLRSYYLAKGVQPRVSYTDHSLMAAENIIPEWLSRLGERIFEGLSSQDAPKFVLDMANAVPPGIDFRSFDKIKWQFSVFLLKENIDRVLELSISYSLKEEVVKAIRQVLAVHEQAILTGKWDESAARSAARSAESAARSAAWSAARSAARSAESAESAASAAWSAASAASSAWSAAWSAESAAYKKYATELLRLLKTMRGKQ